MNLPTRYVTTCTCCCDSAVLVHPTGDQLAGWLAAHTHATGLVTIRPIRVLVAA